MATTDVRPALEHAIWSWVRAAVRMGVGCVWVVAGVLKIPDPAGSVRAVRAYRLLPESVVPTVGYVLPILEVLLGICLVLGLLTRLSAALSCLLLVTFIAGISTAWARGLQIECGCFGGVGGPKEGAQRGYPWDIARDAGLLLLSAWLVWRSRTRWAVDNCLFPETRDLEDS